MSCAADLEEIVTPLLRMHLGDASARLTHLAATQLPSEGFSGHELYRADLAWNGGRRGTKPGSARWVLKRWQPDGHSVRLLSVDAPVEALAWEHGILRPDALPQEVAAPLIGTRHDADGRSVWIAMDDVSADLDQYSRQRPIPGTVALDRLKTILTRLAQYHVWWESPARQGTLRSQPWLVPVERILWCEAGSHAEALGRARPVQAAAGTTVTAEFRANIEAFLAWLPTRDRPPFADLLCNRAALVSAFAPLPRTLLHGDLDDRNIGLRLTAPDAADNPAAAAPVELVLIDWEWMGMGPPALDVSRVWATFAAVCDPSELLPAAALTDELPLFYLEQYRQHGGRRISDGEWRQQFGLALLANGMTQIDFFGAMVRGNVTPVLNTLEPQFAIMVEAARELVAAR